MSSDRLLAELLNRSKLLDHAISHVETATALGGRPVQRDALKALYHAVQVFTSDLGRLRGLALAQGVLTEGNGYNDDWLTVAEPHDAAPASENRDATAPVAAEKILVVDPDDRTRTLATAMLREQGYRVHEARTGEEALAHLTRNADEVHLVIAARQLPGMSGEQLAGAVTTWHPAARLLYTEADAPLRPSELARQVRELLGAEPATGEAFSAA